MQAFVDSCKAFATDLSVSSVIMAVLVVFMLVGLTDKLRGNKLGYGEKFDEGFHAMGPLALAVVGIVSLSPVLLTVLQPLLKPVYALLGADPAMFPATFLALDMGGYVLAQQLAGENIAVGLFAGLVVASMMGITMSFTLPYALSMMKKQERPLLAKGILVGIVTMPLGCLCGGLLMRFTGTPLATGDLMRNLLPVLLLSLLVAIGLWKGQKLTLRLFTGFGKGLTFLVTVSPAVAVLQYLTGIRLPLFSKMVEENPLFGGVPLERGLLLVGQIAVVLIGAFPMIHFLNRCLAKPMQRLGTKTGINTAASTGLLTQLASSIPIWNVLEDMNPRGKLYNIAFAVSGSFVFGDVLAFVGGAAPEMVFPVVGAKLVAGLSAVVLMAFIESKRKEGEKDAGAVQAAISD